MKLAYWIIFVAGVSIGAGGVLSAYTNSPMWISGAILFTLISIAIVGLNDE